MKDKFFSQENCDRCGKKLDEGIMSWFTDETICGDCSDKEGRMKARMRERGVNPDQFTGCGRLPKY